MQIRRTAAALTSAAALSVTGIAMATPAGAAPNDVRQEGLVNLALTDTTIQIPLSIAANVCGVAVNLLAQSTATAPVECTAEGVSTASREAGGPNNTRQEGLVNVAITDTDVQVPVAVAANVCGIAVNVLATTTIVGPTTCEALADSSAQG